MTVYDGQVTENFYGNNYNVTFYLIGWPTKEPTGQPSSSPSGQPSGQPTSQPSTALASVIIGQNLVFNSNHTDCYSYAIDKEQNVNNIGIFILRYLDKFVEVLTSLGKISEKLGANVTSSNVKASLILSMSLYK